MPNPKHCLATAASAPISRTAGENVPKNRLIRTPDGEPGLNYLCAGLKKFYKHALPEVERIVGEIRQQQNLHLSKVLPR